MKHATWFVKSNIPENHWIRRQIQVFMDTMIMTLAFKEGLDGFID